MLCRLSRPPPPDPSPQGGGEELATQTQPKLASAMGTGPAMTKKIAACFEPVKQKQETQGDIRDAPDPARLCRRPVHRRLCRRVSGRRAERRKLLQEPRGDHPDRASARRLL